MSAEREPQPENREKGPIDFAGEAFARERQEWIAESYPDVIKELESFGYKPSPGDAVMIKSIMEKTLRGEEPLLREAGGNRLSEDLSSHDHQKMFANYSFSCMQGLAPECLHRFLLQRFGIADPWEFLLRHGDDKKAVGDYLKSLRGKEELI